MTELRQQTESPTQTPALIRTGDTTGLQWCSDNATHYHKQILDLEFSKNFWLRFKEVLIIDQGLILDIGHRKSCKIMDGLFPDTRFTFQLRKVLGGLRVVAWRIIVSAPVPVPFLWTLNFGFQGLDQVLGIGLRLKNKVSLKQVQKYHKHHNHYHQYKTTYKVSKLSDHACVLLLPVK